MEKTKKPGRPSEGVTDVKINFFADEEMLKYIEAKEKQMGLTGIRYNKSDFLRSLFRSLPDWKELTGGNGQ